MRLPRREDTKAATRNTAVAAAMTTSTGKAVSLKSPLSVRLRSTVIHAVKIAPMIPRVVRVTVIQAAPSSERSCTDSGLSLRSGIVFIGACVVTSNLLEPSVTDRRPYG